MADKLITNIFKNASEPEHSYLYRIIPFNRVEEIFKDKKLYFTNPFEWLDPFEKHWGDLVKQRARLSEKYINYALCFTKHSRSDAMWKVYSKETGNPLTSYRGIRLKIDVKILIEQLHVLKERNSFLYIGDIGYKKDKELVKISNDYSENGMNKPEELAKLWFSKREAFNFEDEVRLFFVKKTRSEQQEKTKAFDFDPMKSIVSMTVDSRLADEEAKILRQKLKDISEFGLNKIIQSQLYKLPKALRK